MNQRRRTRVESRKAVTVVSASGKQGHGEIVNVSLKGCLLEMGEGEDPRPNEMVSVVIHLEPGSLELDVDVTGRVVRVYPGRVAVEFTEVPPESFDHLFRLVQYNAPDPEGIERELSESAFDPTNNLKN